MGRAGFSILQRAVVIAGEKRDVTADAYLR
jgi:hypothetical protein